MSTDLSSLYISESYRRIVQIDPTDGVTLLDGTGSYVREAKILGDLTVTGSIRAQEYIVSSSIINKQTLNVSGSTDFGDSMDDIHKFTGSLNVTGSVTATSLSGDGAGITGIAGAGVWSGFTTYATSSHDIHISGSLKVSGSNGTSFVALNPRVGIGSYFGEGGTPPSGELSISGSGIQNVLLESSDDAVVFKLSTKSPHSSIIDFEEDSSNRFIIGHYASNNSFNIATGSSFFSSSILQIRADGKMAVGPDSGVSTPRNTLHVESSIEPDGEDGVYFDDTGITVGPATGPAGTYIGNSTGGGYGPIVAGVAHSGSNTGLAILGALSQSSARTDQPALLLTGRIHSGSANTYALADNQKVVSITNYTTPIVNIFGDSDVQVSGSLKLSGSLFEMNSKEGNATLHIRASGSGDAVLKIESDSDNSNDNDNPRIELIQDGEITGSAIYQGDNVLSIANSFTSLGGIELSTGTTNGYSNAKRRLFVDKDGEIQVTSSTLKISSSHSPIIEQGYYSWQGISSNADNDDTWQTIGSFDYTEYASRSGRFLVQLYGASSGQAKMAEIDWSYKNQSGTHYFYSVINNYGREALPSSSFAVHRSGSANDGQIDFYLYTDETYTTPFITSIGNTDFNFSSSFVGNATSMSARPNETFSAHAISNGLTLDSNQGGKVGIGKLNPAAELDIVGTTKLTGSLRLSGSAEFDTGNVDGKTPVVITHDGIAPFDMRLRTTDGRYRGNLVIGYESGSRYKGIAVMNTVTSSDSSGNNNYIHIGHVESGSGDTFATEPSFINQPRVALKNEGDVLGLTISGSWDDGAHINSGVIYFGDDSTDNMVIASKRGDLVYNPIGVFSQAKSNGTGSFGLGIGNSTPSAKLHVSLSMDLGTTAKLEGKTEIDGAIVNGGVRSETHSGSPHTLGSSEHLVKLNSSGGVITVNLPDSTTYPGRQIFFKVINGGSTITLQRQGSDQIDGANTDTTLNTTDESLSVVSDGAGNWYIF